MHLVYQYTLGCQKEHDYNSGKERFVCDLCGRDFPKKQPYQDHMKVVHEG